MIVSHFLSYQQFLNNIPLHILAGRNNFQPIRELLTISINTLRVSVNLIIGIFGRHISECGLDESAGNIVSPGHPFCGTIKNRFPFHLLVVLSCLRMNIVISITHCTVQDTSTSFRGTPCWTVCRVWC